MTREEAMSKVKGYLTDYLPSEDDGELEEILKALEQGSCEDCISRAKLLKIYENRFIELQKAHQMDKQLGVNWCINTLKDLPSVIPQEPKWIPVSEKLPEPFMYVNATCRSLVDDRENWVVETIYLPIPKEVNKHGYSDWGNIPMLNCGEAEVIAWVERIIPQPYKAESEDKECTENSYQRELTITLPNMHNF